MSYNFKSSEKKMGKWCGVYGLVAVITGAISAVGNMYRIMRLICYFRKTVKRCEKDQ